MRLELVLVRYAPFGEHQETLAPRRLTKMLPEKDLVNVIFSTRCRKLNLPTRVLPTRKGRLSFAAARGPALRNVPRGCSAVVDTSMLFDLELFAHADSSENLGVYWRGCASKSPPVVAQSVYTLLSTRPSFTPHSVSPVRGTSPIVYRPALAIRRLHFRPQLAGHEISHDMTLNPENTFSGECPSLAFGQNRETVFHVISISITRTGSWPGCSCTHFA